MISFALLSGPVSADQPCGEDLVSDIVVLENDLFAQQERTATSIDRKAWQVLSDKAETVAQQTKNVRVAALLTAVWLRTDGLPGLFQGFQLIENYLHEHWENVYPRLDPEKGVDAEERSNILGSLALRRTSGDVYRIIHGLKKLPLIPPVPGGFTLEHRSHVVRGQPWPEGAGQAPTESDILNAANELPEADAARLVTLAKAILDVLGRITRLFEERAPGCQAPNFNNLRLELEQVVEWIEPLRPLVAPVQPTQDVTVQPQARVTAMEKKVSLSATTGQLEIKSRSEVYDALEAVIAYYDRSEPSSPIAILLRHAQKVIGMDFMQLISELTPDAQQRTMKVSAPSPNTTKP